MNYPFRSAAIGLSVLAVASCAQSPQSEESTQTLQEALQAQSYLSGKTVGQFPIGTSVTTLSADSSQILIAKKTANSDPNKANCGQFDILVHRPSAGNGFFGVFSHGDTKSAKGVEICAPK